MGPKKPRRTNLNEAIKEYQMFQQLNEDLPERPESRNIYLETCFTTFPELPSEEIIKKDVGSLTILDRNKNDILRQFDLGEAPLALPEHFSDTSSVSSFSMKVQEEPPSPSILKAPHMIRRTPRIIGSLSTCTEDIRNVKSFERIKAGTVDSNSSSNLSASTKTSSNECEHFVGMGQCSWQREATFDLDNSKVLAEELLEKILEYADCADFFKSDSSFLEGYDDRLFEESDQSDLKLPTIKLTKSNPSNSPLILSPCSLEIDPDIISNFAMDLNLDQEHRSLLSQQNLQTSILKVQGTFNGSHTPPYKTVTFSPDVLSIEGNALLSNEKLPQKDRSFWQMIPFRYFRRKETSSLPNIAKAEGISVATICSSEKRSIDQLLTRNESLPLLDTDKLSAELRTSCLSSEV